MRKLIMCLKKGIPVCAGILFMGSAFASSISVQPLLMTFNKNGHHSFRDLTVANTGDTVAYVTVKVSKAEHYGQKSEQWIPIHNNPLKFGLITTPSKLIVPAGQMRNVRVMMTRAPRHLSVYRINVAPAEGVLENVKTPGSKILAGVRVIVSYNVIAKVFPSNAPQKQTS